MFLILTLLYLSNYFINASPLPIHLRDGSPDLLPTCPCPDERTIWDIVWSCLATIFACSWVSVHPNIPAPNDRWWTVMFRRLELMFWAIIAPELVIYWAGRQWEGARFFEEQYRHLGWTMTHGHFLQMGGFMLFKGEEAQCTLLPGHFDDLLKKGKIKFPTITQAEIQDRSKGDALSKGLVLVQTTWFIIQCIARKAQGLDTTQIELVTLALATLNGVMYFLWWDKPLDVRCPVPVYLLETPTDPVRGFVSSETGKLSLYGVARINQLTKVLETSWITLFKNVWIQFRDAVYSIGIALKYAVLLPLKTLENKPRFMVPCIILFLWPRSALFVVVHRLGEFMLSEADYADYGDMRAPSFNARSRQSSRMRTSEIIPPILGTVFGAIHCVGWFYTFPTHTEALLWRISSILVATIPVNFFAIFGCAIASRFEVDDSALGRTFFMYALMPFLPSLPVYILARLGLLVEAVISLRALPPKAYANIEWTQFIPHI